MSDNANLAIVPVRTEAQAIDAVKLMANIVRTLRTDVLKKDMDYGIIPGTGDKPTLLLPGMEKLMRALNAVPEYIEKCVIRDYDKPLFHYEYECRLIDADTGLAIPGGRGIGLCTSYESSFRWRDQKRCCPNCGKATINKSKFAPKNNPTAEPGWYCYSKAGGCGAEFAFNDVNITSQPIGKIENPDIFDQVNAIMKRAKKRALGDAIKGAANVSEFFTVDLEDFARFDDVVEGSYTEIKPDKTADSQTPPATDKPATPKNAPVSAGYQLPDLYNAVLKTEFKNNSMDMRSSISHLLEIGKLPPALTLTQAIEVVKERAKWEVSAEI